MRNCRTNTLSRAKIKSIPELRKIIPRLKGQGKKIVFTNGCFDLLHYGHVKYLEDTKKEGDVLIVGINSDSSIKRIKGNKRPIINQHDRLRIIAGLASVDYVVMFNEYTPLKIIKLIKPDILVKGSDWTKKSIVGADLVLDYGGKVRTVKLVRGRSTTSIINKIAKKL